MSSLVIRVTVAGTMLRGVSVSAAGVDSTTTSTAAFDNWSTSRLSRSSIDPAPPTTDGVGWLGSCAAPASPEPATPVPLLDALAIRNVE
jgi:hypothetical protein